MALFERWLQETSSIQHSDRPLVTVSFAQAADGSIAGRRGQPTPISGAESLVYTHKLRAAHDAILVGIETVLADDPQLNVREVKGKDPQVVVLDNFLRTPMNSKVMQAKRKPWIFAGSEADTKIEKRLKESGASVFWVDETDGLLNLKQVLKVLKELGIQNVMVEGGGLVLRSFMREALADRAMITIAPKTLDGYKIDFDVLSAIQDVQTESVGKDKIVFGRFELQPQ